MRYALHHEAVFPYISYSGCSNAMLIFIVAQEANETFLEELGKRFHYKKISRHKLHPEYQNNLIEVIVGKPIRKVSKAEEKLDSTEV